MFRSASNLASFFYPSYRGSENKLAKRNRLGYIISIKWIYRKKINSKFFLFLFHKKAKLTKLKIK